MNYLYGARLITPNEIKNGSVLIKNGKIQHIYFDGEAPSEASIKDCRKTDLNGLYLSCGFIETHMHGAGGYDYNDGTCEAFEKAATAHLLHGATTICPTIAAANFDETLKTIDAFYAAKKTLGSILYGIHLEGPYLNINQKGAIDAKYIRPPVKEEYAALIKKADGAIKRWTFAPELEGSMEFLEYLIKNNVLPSIGHSDAEYTTVKEAYNLGCRLITHLYSATSTIVRKNGFRFPGIIESAFCIEGMVSEIIADGCHLPLEMLHMLWRLLGPEHVILSTDSMRCAGTNVKEAMLGSQENGQKIIIEDDVAKLPDRSAFAGSIATPDRLIRTMLKAGVPLVDCVKMYTQTPAALLNISSEKGSLVEGKTADLICFDDEIKINGVYTESVKSGLFA